MDKAKKEQLVGELVKDFNAANAAFFSDYKGLNVEKITDLRRRLRPHDVKVRIVKNNLVRVAVAKAGLGDGHVGLADGLAGPTMVAFAFKDAATVAKIIAKFSTENEVFTIKEGLLGAKRISQPEVVALSALPSREVLLAKLLGTFNAPVTNFVGVLAAVPRSLVQVLAAVQQKKGQ